MKTLKYLVVLLFFTSSVLFSSVEFTKDEIDWIKKSPVIKLGADYKWPPFDFADSKGNHTGLSSEYIKLISEKSGLKFEVFTGVWADVLEDMQAKKYDGLSSAVETDERKKYLKFTDPYLTVPMVIITPVKNTNIKSIDDLNGKSVSINKGSYIHEWLETQYPKINLYLTTSNEASLEAVSLGKADAYVGNLAVSTYIMNKYLLNDLKIVTKLKVFKTAVSVAVDKENTMLFNIIQKSLASITPEEHQEIKKRWQENLGVDNKLLTFTKKQKEWIKKHKVIKFVIDNHWEPLEYISKDTEQYEGVTSDYIDLISKRTGIEFKLVPTNIWTDSVDKIKTKDADLFSCVAKTDTREKSLNYSTSYLHMPQVFVTNKNQKFITDIKELYGKKVILVEGYYLVEIIKAQHPKIEIIEVEKAIDAFNMLTNKDAYAYIELLPIASHYIQKEGFSNLKISGMSGYQSEYSMAMRKELGKEGIEIINAVLDSVTEEEKSTIYNKWLHVHYDKEIDYTLVWQIISVFALLIVASLFWNKKLSIEIEKRKSAQEELIKLNQKLEEATDIAQSANKAKSDFLSNMSHEIRTPMNAILGFAELLDDSIEDKKLKSFIKTIRSSGKTLLFLINDILDLSKIESGKLEIVKSRVNVQTIFEETIDIFKLQAEQKGLKLEVDISREMPTSLLIDAVRFKQVLINLIGNALKFTEQGHIKVVVTVNKVYEHMSKIDLTIRIEDSGIGIPKSEQENIFNIFVQTQNQDVRKYGGTGLGLSISKKLVTLMNGTLRVESEVGVGSAFIISLKKIDIASLDDEDMQDPSIEYGSVKFDNALILIVDDIKENRDLIKESFSGTKVKVIEAVNGKEAIEIVKSNDIDLILMDIRMPVMDGYTATRLIKEFSTVPIIALTASIMQDELKKLEGERFNGYLRKPVSKNELFKEVSRFLNYNNAIAKAEVKEEIKIDDIEELTKFLAHIKPEIEQLYKQSRTTNDLAIITQFSKTLLELALKHNIKDMINYSELLLEKINTFEIDSISSMLDSYPIKTKELQSIKEAWFKKR